MMKKSRGFTLIEVLIAVSILAGGLLAAFYMFPLGMRQLRISRILMDISFLAKAKLEEIKTYNIVEDGSGQEGDLEWQISLAQEEPLASISLRKVILKVRYASSTGAIEEEFVTYLSEDTQEAQ
jgi:prepilin-type N-terminal cleavage/methylation domain-containing protein